MKLNYHHHSNKSRRYLEKIPTGQSPSLGQSWCEDQNNLPWRLAGKGGETRKERVQVEVVFGHESIKNLEWVRKWVTEREQREKKC